MVSGVIVVTVGLPGSGKTTFCNKLINEEKLSSCWKIVHVCYDEIVDDRSNWQSPDFQWRTERTNVVVCLDTLLYRILHNVDEKSQQNDEDFPTKMYSENFAVWETIKENFVILIDDNMYYRSMRYVYYQLVRKYRLGFVQVYFKCSYEIASSRNATRSDSERIPDSVMRRMFERLETPDGSKNDWEKRTEQINVDENSNSSLLSRCNEIFVEALNSPPTPLPSADVVDAQREQSRLATKENNLHQADLILRKLIGKIRKYYVERRLDDVNEICARISRTKCEILSNMRSNLIDSSLARDVFELKRLFVDLVGLSSIFYSIIDDDTNNSQKIQQTKS